MLNICFLNVGKGNCTIIDFPSERLSMVDIDNSGTGGDKELTDPIQYLQKRFPNRSLFRFILTHPDMDHMSGLDQLANSVGIANLWDTKHNKTISDGDWEGSPYNRKDWERYLTLRKSSESPKCLELYRDQTSECCWTQDNIRILSPTPELVELSAKTEEYHHLSYVLIVEYAGRRVLLGGDASVEAWDDILKKCGADSLKSDIFLAPHHGSKNNIHEEAFKAISPEYVIVSLLEGVDYDYEYYKKLGKKVLSTKYHGTIRIQIEENGKFDIYVEKNA